MVAIPGGTFVMGSPAGEAGRAGDEGPAHPVRIAPFWMARTETTWDEYDPFAFGQSIPAAAHRPRRRRRPGRDAMTRPTPPYGDESFGFGKGRQPAINVQYHAAMEYCRWLSLKTGQDLPPADRGRMGVRGPRRHDHSVLLRRRSGQLDEYAWYTGNSGGRPIRSARRRRIPGDFSTCTETSPNGRSITTIRSTYARFRRDAPTRCCCRRDRRYPYVVRGGSWDDPAPRLRSAARRGSSEEWNRRDPQSPQSIWWHTDATFVGFRVVRAVEEQDNLKGLRSRITPASRLARLERQRSSTDEHRHVETS